MKWFKHYSNALHSDSLSLLLKETGLQGYARYWLLLEMLCSRYNGESTDFNILAEDLRSLFRIRSWNELDSFSIRLSNVRGMELKRNQNVFEIKAPIILELLDRDFRKSRVERVDPAPKKKNKIKKENNIPVSDFLDFESAYVLYANKKGKTKGMARIKKEITNQTELDLFKKAVLNHKAEMNRLRTDVAYIQYFSSFVSEWRDWIEFGKPQVSVMASRQKEEVYKHIDNFEYNDNALTETITNRPELKNILELLTKKKELK